MVSVSTSYRNLQETILWIAFIGGGLQGVEAAYLSKKAGFEILMVDKRPDPPAKGLAQIFVQADVTRFHQVPDFMKKAALILPALENDKALAILDLWQQQGTIPVCFDLKAYGISSSKLLSNRLFARLDIPRPAAWPLCGFPLILKPSTGSGSIGVAIIPSREQWPPNLDPNIDPGQWVIEEYIQGPSYSLEIIGSPGRYETLTVTEIFVDEHYDCRQVMAPAEIDPDLVQRFEQSARTIADTMGLTGIMDFEVILHQGQLKMLEIDARFPSQTPMAVYAATGKNMIEMLADLTLGRPVLQPRSPNPVHGIGPGYAAVLHIHVSSRGIQVRGENIMKSRGPLHMESTFFGADEAITSFVPGCETWVATLIIQGKTRQEVREKRNQVFMNLSHGLNLPLLPDIKIDGESISFI